jgi:hypothetical protein
MLWKGSEDEWKFLRGRVPHGPAIDKDEQEEVEKLEGSHAETG